MAGHGSQSPDYTGDESDGMNETICPCDFQNVRHRLSAPCGGQGKGVATIGIIRCPGVTL